MGWPSFKKGQWADAALYYELFWQNFPDDPGLEQVVFDLGRSYEQMGETDIAADVYEEFLNTTRKSERIKARLEELQKATDVK